ncbi:eukaryotic translation initiation factor 4G-like [Phalaenopsis equestris]|uniref:eukaryotic translation initiation factor 4G-like n=1 Tax=Phalaenopsis equestris TaxID=78828 RepID=UPI0009E49125|nr:eukaryotic translation initiation factor 4G-like [Phalaenopsis equestris]
MQDQRPTAYFSQVLIVREKLKSIYVRELMAIVLAIQKWCPYILGRHFLVIIDQRSLKYLLEQRMLCPVKERREPSLAALSVPLVFDWEGTRKESEQDERLRKMSAELLSDPNNHPGYALRRNNNSTRDGSYYRGHRKLYLLEMHKDVKDMVTRCDICHRHKYMTMEPGGLLQPLALPENAWEEVTMDFIKGLPQSNGFTVILVVVDRLSKDHTPSSSLLLTLTDDIEVVMNRSDTPREESVQRGPVLDRPAHGKPAGGRSKPIPARTTSAPPNLDEQKRDQARHDSFRAVPTLPIPSIPKPQQQQKQEKQQPKKVVEGVNKPNNGETHSPIQTKREIHATIPSAHHPNTTTTRPSVLPSNVMPIPVSFQQPQIHFQFNGPNPPLPSQSVVASSLQMPMALPAGNVTHVPHQLFVPNIQSHPLQPQAIMHQGHGLGFTPQLGHQMPSQLGGMGIGIVPQFPQQQPQFGTQRRAVKITHPDTHEELKLDKRSDSHIDAGTTGQRQLQNVSSQSQPLPSFSPSHQINYYKSPSQIFFPPSSLHMTSTQMPTGAPAVRYGYPVSQNGQAISFMNPPSSLNQTLGGRAGPPPPLHSLGEAVHSEGSSFSATLSAPVQVTIKPIALPISEKTGKSSVRVSLPATKPEPTKLSALQGDASSVPCQKNNKIDLESSVILQNPIYELSGSVSSVESDKAISTVPLIASTEINRTEVPQSLHSVEDSLSVMLETDGQKNEAKKSLESIMDLQNMSSEREPRLSQLQQDIIGVYNDNGTSKSVSNDFASIPSAPTADSPSSTTRLLSTYADSRNYRSVLNTDVMRTSGPPVFSLENADQGADHVEVAWHKHFHKEAEKPQTSVSSILSATGIVSETPSSVLSGPTQENLVAAQKLGGEASDVVLLDSNSAKESAVYPTESVQRPENIIGAELDTSEGINSEVERKSGAELDTSEGINSEVERTRNSSIPSTSSSDNKESAAGLFDQVLSTIPVGSATTDCELTCNKEIDVNEFATLQPETISIPQVCSEVEQNMEEEVVDQSNGIPRVMILELKDKPEPTKGKTNRKKKIRDVLSKADAAGASDLYNAYKTTKETHDATVSTSETDSRCSTAESKNDTSQCCSKVATSVEEDGQYKPEVQDWEEAADASIPKLRASDNDAEKQNQNDQGNQSSGRKKYSRDFLLAFSQQCNDLPEGFENGPDIAHVLNLTSVGIKREPNFSTGRLIDRSPGASRIDKRSSSISDDDKWTRPSNSFHMDLSHGTAAINFRSGQGVNNGVLRHPHNGILSGPIQSLVSQGGMSRSNLDIDRWQHAGVIQRGLFPTPHEPLQIMHKSSNRYEVGKSIDEEEQKQRLLKAILNKLTPQNFEKLFSQVKDVKIDNAVTLSGVISQIFDKALMEPTFCEMYADFCFHLASELPDFLENNEKITFRRLLLNKCQEEFERGEREQAEANKTEEEGEISQTEDEREEKKNRARRRMLGNIRLIGELYKKRMLTERIMHECIQKMLGYRQIPDEEDIESLCKLMNTIGVMIDHSKAKELMDSYFNRITILSTNEKLSSRVRFMLKDTIDLRKNKWQQRRKIEGPKKIEDVHKDAAQERQAQTTRLARGPAVSSRRGGPTANFGHWATTNLNSPSSQANNGIRGLPTQARGFSSQDVRQGDRQQYESRVMSVPLPQRPSDDGSVTLGPQGGLAKGMSGRGLGLIPNVPSVEISSRAGDPHRFVSGSNVFASSSDRMTSTSREDSTNKYMNDRLSGASNDQISFQVRNSHFSVRDSLAAGITTSGERPVSSGGKVRESNEAKLFSEDALREKSISAIREFYSAKDEGEVVACIKELNAPHFYPSMVSVWVTDSFERKLLERNLLAELLVSLNKSHYTLISRTQLISGFESVLSSLEDAMNDAPKAAEFLGQIFGKIIVENVVSLKEIGGLIREGGEEPGGLVEFGLASEILLGILEFIKADRGESVLNEIRRGSNLRLEDFRPQKPTQKSKKLDEFL